MIEELRDASTKRDFVDENLPANKKICIKFNNTELHEYIFAFLGFEGILLTSKICRLWRHQSANTLFYHRALHASGLLIKPKETAGGSLRRYMEENRPEAYLGLSTGLFNAGGYCTGPKLLFQTLQCVTENTTASSQQKVIAYSMQAVMRARQYIDDTLLRPSMASDALTALGNGSGSTFITGVAQYGRAMLGAYKHLEIPDTEVFNLFKSVHSNKEVAKELRANANFWMAKLRLLHLVSNELMSDIQAFQAFQSVHKPKSAAFLSYRVHSLYWQVMLRLEARIDDTLMTPEQAFDQLRVFLQCVDLKPKFAQFACLEMAKLRVASAVGEERMNDLTAANILKDFYLRPPTHAESEGASALVNLCLLFIMDRIPILDIGETKLFNDLKGISEFDGTSADVREQALFCIAILKCQGVFKDSITDNEAYRLLTEEVYPYRSQNDPIRRLCEYWAVFLHSQGRLDPEKLSNNEALQILDNLMSLKDGSPISRSHLLALKDNFDYLT